MSPFNRDMGEAVLVTVSMLSEREVEPFVQAKVAEFIAAPCTPVGLYDFLNELSRIQCDRITLSNGRRIAVGYISAFVQSACEVEKYYIRPSEDEGESKMIDVAAVKTMLESPK